MTKTPDTLSGGGLEEAAEKYANEHYPLEHSEHLMLNTGYRVGFLKGARHMEAELLRERERSRGLLEFVEDVANASETANNALAGVFIDAGYKDRANALLDDYAASHRASAKEGEKE